MLLHSSFSIQRFFKSFHIPSDKIDCNLLTLTEWSQLDKHEEMCVFVSVCICSAQFNTGGSFKLPWVICSADKRFLSQLLFNRWCINSVQFKSQVLHTQLAIVSMFLSFAPQGYCFQSHNQSSLKVLTRIQRWKRIQGNLWSSLANKSWVYFQCCFVNFFLWGLVCILVSRSVEYFKSCIVCQFTVFFFFLSQDLATLLCFFAVGLICIRSKETKQGCIREKMQADEECGIKEQVLFG